MIITAIKLIIAIVPIFLAGRVIYYFAFRDSPAFRGLPALALYFGLGAGFISWTAIVFMLVGIPFRYTLALTALSVALYVCVLVKTRKNTRNRDHAGKPPGKPRGKQTAVLTAVILLAAAVVFFRSVIFPMHYWDARIIWNYKAKVIFQNDTVFCGEFFDTDRLHLHPKYPLHLPCMEAWVYRVLGRTDDWAVMPLIPLYYLMLLPFFYGILKKLSGSRTALVSTAILSLLPPFHILDGPAHSGYADTPLAFFFTCAVLLLYTWLEERRRPYLLLGAAFTGFACYTKVEGVLLFILVLAWLCLRTLVIDGKGDRASAVKDLLVFTAVVTVLALPQYIIYLRIPNHTADIETYDYLKKLNPAAVYENLQRLPVIARHFLREYFIWAGHWGLLWYGFIICAVYSCRKRNISVLSLMALPAAYTAVMGFVYLITPYARGFEAQMEYSLSRLTLHTAPAALFAMALLARSGTADKNL